MSSEVEQQLRDYFADLDASQPSVDVTAIARVDRTVDAPMVERIDTARARRTPRRRTLVLVASAAVVVVVVGVGLLVNVNDNRQAVEVVPADPDTSVEPSVPSVLRMTCPSRDHPNEGGLPTLESRRVALQADGLHVEVAPHRGEPLHIWARNNYDVNADIGFTKSGEVSELVIPANLLTDLEPSAIELAIACGYTEPFSAPPQFFNEFTVTDPDDVWTSSPRGCRGRAIESDTVNEDGFDDLTGDEFASLLRARTPGIRESDTFRPTDGGFSVMREGEPVARWYVDVREPERVSVLVTCPGSGIGTLG